MGLVPGNRVLLRGPNNPMMAACWFAVMKAGGVVRRHHAAAARQGADRRSSSKAEVTHALCDERLDDELTAARPRCPTLKQIKYWYDDGADSLDALRAASSRSGSPTSTPPPTTSR